MRQQVKDAIEHLDDFGYCVLEGLMPRDVSESLAKRCLELHEDPKVQEYNAPERNYATLYGMLNLDDRTWDFASHPDAVAVAKHFLGKHFIVGQVCSKPNFPGAKAGGLHSDDTHMFQEVPHIPWLINTMWALTDFTIENGATGLVPMSHKMRMDGPPGGMDHDHPLVKQIVADSGTLLMWHGGTFHTNCANTTDQVRVGLNVSYFTRWYNIWSEEGHQPLWRETYDRMPKAMQKLCPGKFGHHAKDVYEQF